MNEHQEATDWLVRQQEQERAAGDGVVAVTRASAELIRAKAQALNVAVMVAVLLGVGWSVWAWVVVR